jgi:hypothetical protein
MTSVELELGRWVETGGCLEAFLGERFGLHFLFEGFEAFHLLEKREG